MPNPYEIRADFDRETIVIYQAYSPAIAEPALKAQRFVPPFSVGRMTWIKPSFLWLMHRSNWGQKKDQERTLAVRIKTHRLGQSPQPRRPHLLRQPTLPHPRRVANSV